MHRRNDLPDVSIDSATRILQRLHGILMTTMVITGGVFVWRYRSDNAFVGQHSWRYLLGVVTPWAALGLVTLGMWLRGQPSRVLLDAVLRGLSRRSLHVLPILAVAGGLVLSLVCPICRAGVVVRGVRCGDGTLEPDCRIASTLVGHPGAADPGRYSPTRSDDGDSLGSTGGPMGRGGCVSHAVSRTTAVHRPWRAIEAESRRPDAGARVSPRG